MNLGPSERLLLRAAMVLFVSLSDTLDSSEFGSVGWSKRLSNGYRGDNLLIFNKSIEIHVEFEERDSKKNFNFLL